MSGASQRALERLLERRNTPGEDRQAIDEAIRERFEEEWTIVFTDLVGFSKTTRDFGIVHFLGIIYQKGVLCRPIVDEHGGLILKEEADSWIVIFRKPETALKAIIACQHACQAYNEGARPEDKVELCVGIGFGPTLKIGDDDVWGREVNYASKLGEDIARADEILLTEEAHRAIGDKVPGVTFEEDHCSFGPLELPYYRVGYDRK
ncbi:MAG: adenylate/guanylate cyclase domain-containing protein [Deltaproteobacteria bacterium]|nr:adenylate/guanylate cyclase domain-containing protein [Deltaproteobacteria bacterium]